jgi:hypothetical protein
MQTESKPWVPMFTYTERVENREHASGLHVPYGKGCRSDACLGSPCSIRKGLQTGSIPRVSMFHTERDADRTHAFGPHVPYGKGCKPGACLGSPCSYIRKGLQTGGMHRVPLFIYTERVANWRHASGPLVHIYGKGCKPGACIGSPCSYIRKGTQIGRMPWVPMFHMDRVADRRHASGPRVHIYTERVANREHVSGLHVPYGKGRRSDACLRSPCSIWIGLQTGSMPRVPMFIYTEGLQTGSMPRVPMFPYREVADRTHASSPYVPYGKG